MRTSAIIYLLLLTFIHVNGQGKYTGEPFTKIQLSDMGKVILRQDSVYSISYEDKGIKSSNPAVVKNGKLMISGILAGDIHVSMPELTEITIDGHGSVIGENTFSAEDLYLEINGDGKITLAVTAKKVDASIHGVGKIELSGTALDSYFSIPGSGKIDAGDMKTIHCVAGISGLGKCIVDPIDELHADISGNGTILYKTVPKNIYKNISGIGKIESLDDDETASTRDTTKLEFGRKEVWIINNRDSVRTKKHTVKPIWAGFELGINSYLDNGGSFTLSQGKENFDLRTEKSVSAALNLFQKDFQLGRSNLWFLTGLGITWNNYRFDNNIILQGGSVTRAIVDTTSDVRYLKSKLTTSYLTAPVMFQFFTSRNIKKAFHVGAGAMFGLRIGSHTKRKVEINDEVTKIKDHDDFNLNPFRYGFRVTAGYGKFNLFVDYYASTLFKNNKGPVLYPVNAGITFIGF